MSYTFLDYLNENNGDIFEDIAIDSLNKIFIDNNINLKAINAGHNRNKASDVEIIDLKTNKPITYIECKLSWFDQLLSPRVSIESGKLVTNNKQTQPFVEYLNTLPEIQSILNSFCSISKHENTVEMTHEEIYDTIAKINRNTGKLGKEYKQINGKLVRVESRKSLIDVYIDNDKFFDFLVKYYNDREFNTNQTDYLLFGDIGLIILNKDILHLCNHKVYLRDLSKVTICNINVRTEFSNGSKSFKLSAKLQSKNKYEKKSPFPTYLEHNKLTTGIWHGLNLKYLKDNFTKEKE